MSRTGQSLVALAALVVGVFLAWCHREPPPASAPTLPLSVEFGGCHHVRLVPDTHELECVYQSDRPVRLWVNHAGAAEARVLVDDQPVAAERYTVEYEPGAGYRVSVGPGARTLSVHSTADTRWSLHLRDIDDVEPAAKTLRQEFYDRALAAQEAMRDGDAHGLSGARAVIEDTLSAGLLSDALRFAAGTSYHALTALEQPLAAQEVLERMLGPAESFRLGHATLAIYLSRTLRLRGRHVDAIPLARDGTRVMLHLEDVPQQIDGLTEYTLLLASLGYTEAAAYWGDYALAQARRIDSRELSDLLEATAVVGLQLAEAGQRHRAPRRVLQELLERCRPDGPKPSKRLFARGLLLLAELAMLEGDPRRALAHLDRLDPEHLRRRHHTDVHSIALEAHVALGADASVLERGLERLAELIPKTMESRIRWRATVSQGIALEALGRLPEAEQAYVRSEEILDSMLSLAALGIGGETLAANHARGTQRLLQLMLREPAPRRSDALCVARHAQARLARLSSLAQRLDDQAREALGPYLERYAATRENYERGLEAAVPLPEDELERARQDVQRRELQLQREALTILSTSGSYEAPPTCEGLRPRQPGELLLSLVPFGDDLLVLAAHDDGLEHYWTGPSRDPATQATSLQGLIAAVLDRATKVRVLATGTARRLAVHAMPYRGKALGTERAVVYGLELGGLDRPRAGPSPRHAVVLHDAMVPNAAQAADAATRGLGTLDLQVHRYSTRDDLADQIRQHLAGASFFFYAGHAYFSAPAPTRARTTPLALTEREAMERWPPHPGGAAVEPSYLPLGSVARLTVADIAMMPDPPSVVVLMGCATGANDDRVVYGGQSLAASYLGAGARVAIASTRPVEESEAFLVNRGLAEHLEFAVADDPGQWMQHALQWAVANGLPRTAIADYRVYVP